MNKQHPSRDLGTIEMKNSRMITSKPILILKRKSFYTVTGTHNLKDWGTNAYLAAGKIIDMNRHKSADNGLKKAKLKYGVSDASIYGHSLGGTIAGYIGGKGDTVKTLDKGATIGQKVRSNEKAYRTAFDPVSLLNANSKNMTTLPNTNKKVLTGLLPLDAVINGVKAHDGTVSKDRHRDFYKFVLFISI